MSAFHRHKWEEQRRTFAPPPAHLVEIERATGPLIRQLTFGVTTIEDRCAKCNQLRVSTVLGDAA